MLSMVVQTNNALDVSGKIVLQRTEREEWGGKT